MRAETGLTARQQQVVDLLRHGLTNKEIAAALRITEDGVKAHLSRMYLRFAVTNRVALLARLDALPPRPTPPELNLGDLRTIASRSHVRSAEQTSAGLMSASDVVNAREVLASVDVALDLVRDLPPETTGPVLDALRKRVAAAVVSLDSVDARVLVQSG